MVLVSVPLLLGLGVWQMERADQKGRLAQDMERQAQLPPLELQSHSGLEPPLAYREARVQGCFDAERQVYIENRKHGGRIGYHVVTPLQILDSDTWVLINRGWIPRDSTAEPQAVTPDTEVSVSGLVYVPEAPALVLGDSTTWNRTWPYLTLADYQAREDVALLPFVLLQDPDDEHGFVRNWPREEPNPAMHIGYAIQWFAFAVIASLIYLRLCLEPRKEAVA